MDRMISMKCQFCHHEFEVPRECAGMRGDCEKCGQEFSVPSDPPRAVGHPHGAAGDTNHIDFGGFLSSLRNGDFGALEKMRDIFRFLSVAVAAIGLILIEETTSGDRTVSPIFVIASVFNVGVMAAGLFFVSELAQACIVIIKKLQGIEEKLKPAESEDQESQ